MSDVVNRGQIATLVATRKAVDLMLELDRQVIQSGGGFKPSNSTQFGSLSQVIKTARPKSLHVVEVRLEKRLAEGYFVMFSVANTEETPLRLVASLGVKSEAWASSVLVSQIIPPDGGEKLFEYSVPDEIVHDPQNVLYFSGLSDVLRRVDFDYKVAILLPADKPKKNK